MRNIQVFVALDAYETTAIQRVQELMKAAGGRVLSDRELIRACVRYFIHDVMPEEFVLGDDAMKAFKDAGLDPAQIRGA